MALLNSIAVFVILGGDDMNDRAYMRLALQLAEKGCGWTSPNPMVGAVIVKNERNIVHVLNKT